MPEAFDKHKEHERTRHKEQDAKKWQQFNVAHSHLITVRLRNEGATAGPVTLPRAWSSPTPEDRMADDRRVKALLAQAIVMSTAYWNTCPPPANLVNVANANPLALYIAIKFLQSLPKDHELRESEPEMRAVLLACYPNFVREALATDPKPADLVGSRY